MTKRQYDQLVAEGRRVESGRNWALGDLALEVETSYGEHKLEEYAADIEVDYNSLRAYRYVAGRFENDIRISILPWAVHQVFAPLQDRSEVITSRSTWTVAEAREYVERRGIVIGELLREVDELTRRTYTLTTQVAEAPLDDVGRSKLDRQVVLFVDAVANLRATTLTGDVDRQLAQLSEENER